MRLPRFEFLKPVSLEESLTLLEKSGRKAKVLAGGTDLLVNMKYGVLRPETVISVKGIPELSSISAGMNGNTEIGACVTLTDLAGNSLIAGKFPAFQGAVRSVASKHIRNMASIGGNICLDTRCWYYNQSKLWRDARELCHRTGGKVCHAIKGSTRCHAINSSDTAPALIALDAKIAVMKKGQKRLIPAKEFYRDDGIRHTSLEPGEMVTSIQLPEGNGNSQSIFIKVSTRKGIDFATGSIAAHATVNDKGVSGIRLVLGSISSAPILLDKTSQVIMESGLTEKSIEKAAETARSELGTLTNLFTSAGYKRHLVEVLVRRALSELKEKIGRARK
ncbi:MAG: FAD binding domain-containing protein [Proteobacteria bacterium]|nr:FAD binding domain-containing protein [Pseudomonadota bacterium]